MDRFLRSRLASVEVWDHPHILKQPRAVADLLADHLTGLCKRFDEVTLVTHSFGDWVARRALLRSISDNQAAGRITKFCSICPVVTSVPIAALGEPVFRHWIPELSVLANSDAASINLELPASIDRMTIWARWDWWIRTVDDSRSNHITVNGTHNSVLLQCNLWNQVLRFIGSPELSNSAPEVWGLPTVVDSHS